VYILDIEVHFGTLFVSLVCLLNCFTILAQIHPNLMLKCKLPFIKHHVFFIVVNLSVLPTL